MVTVKFSLFCLLAAPVATAYSFAPRNNAWVDGGNPFRSPPMSVPSGGTMNMFLGKLGQSFKIEKKLDTNTIGTTPVPVVGVGTISWSSDSCKLKTGTTGNMETIHHPIINPSIYSF